jgi:ABC-type ATPase involved in cell division
MLTCLKGTLLRLEHVSWSSWGGGRATAVLRDVSLDVEAGALAGVCGPRPAELTALATVAAGRRAPHAGAVLLDGLPLGDLARGGGPLARIGFAHRDGPEADDLNVVTWMASALLDAGSWRTARRRAWTAAARVGLGTAATLRWPELSPGERARAAIAQALVRGPRVLVVDGPVADVDDEDRAAVLDLLRAFAAEGVAVLATAADASQLPGFDLLWTLADGRLTGPPPRPLGQVIPLRARRD